MNNNYKKIIISAPAKINLYLEILDKLDNGYHNIDSIMHSIDLSDTIVISIHDIETPSPLINLVCNNINIPVGKKNLAYIAAEKFCNRYGIKNKHIYIYIDKKIPVAAGLAGGSTDAAAVMIGLNILLDLKIKKDELCNLGVTIGADVPFCILKGAMYAKGIGDVLVPCPTLPDCYILIVISDSSVSTKTAYELYDLLKPPKDIYLKHRLINGLNSGDLKMICDNLYNTFENVINESIKTLKIVNNYNPIGALMSGSGPAVYAIFDLDDKQIIDYAAEQLNNSGFKTYICRPCQSQELYILND